MDIEKLVNVINDFKKYYESHNQVIYDNPSYGNKEGGISSLEDKSLGCIRKAGSSEIVDVLRMTERVKEKGLNIISAPGNDSVSTTILGMAGCQLVLFSTGRGTPFGGFMPTVKISSNTSLYEKKKKWIDFNAGDVNNENIESIKDKLFDYVIDVIEGKKTMNEINNFREIAIFKSGVTL
jgi:altronate hydrolase